MLERENKREQMKRKEKKINVYTFFIQLDDEKK